MRVMQAWGYVFACALCWSACSDDSGTDTNDNTGAAGSSMEAGGAAGAAGKGAAGTGAAGTGETSTAEVDLDAFEATGLNKYLGKAKPASMDTAGAETHYTFNEADGPVCLRGGQYAMATRDGSSPDNLVIYFQGGGSCTTALCRATETANPAIPTYGVLAAGDVENPVATWNVVYAPYCDGSLHFGDSEIPDQNRKHHGLKNTSAALDVAVAKYPNPKRILLTGSSAGGYATIWMTDLVRLIWPDAKLYVFNDAGIAISNPDSPDGFRSVLGEWGAAQFIPESCDACKTSPHLTTWQSWNLQHDPGMKLGMFSAYEDAVISGTFLMLDPAVFKQALLDETQKVVETAPTRAKRFLVDGTQHTVGNIHTTAVGDMPVASWLKLMLDEDPAWDNELQ